VRALLQRVSQASVKISGEVVGEIGPGLCALVGVCVGDTEAAADWLATKIWNARLFPGQGGNMERSASELQLEVLVVSQFTLCADTRRGRRPSFANAAPPSEARPLVERVTSTLRAMGAQVATGRFGATMQLYIVNEGPVTVLLEA
jgi:D-tyrosyl-tRNA(Tyr) deacylase